MWWTPINIRQKYDRDMRGLAALTRPMPWSEWKYAANLTRQSMGRMVNSLMEQGIVEKKYGLYRRRLDFDGHHAIRVYMAGPVIVEKCEEDLPGEIFEVVDQWREEVGFAPDNDSGSCGSIKEGETAEFGERQFIYAGPDIYGSHGQPMDRHSSDYPRAVDLVHQCIRQVKECDVLFAWINREETVGTIVEIATAHASRKPIFMAFASKQLRKHFYFVEPLAQHSVVAPLPFAWGAFTHWINGRRG
jgi:hypothetical protein